MSFRNASLILSWIARVCACVVILAVVLLLANSQVVMVSNKLLAPRAASRTKSKPKSRRAVAPSPVVETELVPEATLPLLSFAVTLPPLKIENVEATGKPVAWPELLGYEFDVIKADDRGHVRERRKERARFYLEGLSGGVNLEMVEVPAGTFLMGSSDTELEMMESNYLRGLTKEARPELHNRLQSEAPQRMVKITAFFLGKYEVTQAQWRAVASLPKVNHELMSDPSHFKGGNRPVEQVSWEEAVEFCERLSRATGRRYRLPAEAEWEYACRAGTRWPFSFGETVSPDWVNYNGKLPYGQTSRESHRQQTVVAGSLGMANAFGLYDTHGNVWEWCLDSWHENYLLAPVDGVAWQKDGVTEPRILRGGAWDSPAGDCRSSERRQAAPNIRLNNIGFRVAAEIGIPLASK
ncbi:MAG: formylglycine-generating enzyme family protein [Acidobacteriota bacterium]